MTHQHELLKYDTWPERRQTKRDVVKGNKLLLKF